MSFLYELCAAATMQIDKALIRIIVDKNDTDMAIGSFAGFQSIVAMIASSLAGFVWFWVGAEETFYSTKCVNCRR